jgi:hypothetical protein
VPESATAHALLAFCPALNQALKAIPIVAMAPNYAIRRLIVHSVPTAPANVDQAEYLSELRKEIEDFNPTLSVATIPRWLSTENHRTGKATSSLVITLHDNGNVDTFLPKGILIYNKHRRVEPYLTFGPSTQCNRCQHFGHHTLRCKNQPACRICARSHWTKDHHCGNSTCKVRGRTCPYTILKCVNCSLAHRAADPACSVLSDACRKGKEADPDDREMEDDTDQVCLV